MLIRPSQLIHDVIGAAIEVHRVIGPGLFESLCHECFAHELALRGLAFASEVPVPVSYKGIDIKCGYRADLVVENTLVVEIKSVEHVLPVHRAQVLTYMRLLEKKDGLLLNFNVPLLKDGIYKLIL
jgi:GxxExxY protein